MYFTYSPLKAAGGLVTLSSLLNSSTFPFSPSPLPLKWPEFENHLPSGWDVLTVFFQFSVAGTFHSLMRAHGCPESAPHSWDPACEEHGLQKSVCSEWCRSLCLLKPKYRRKIRSWVFKGGNVGEALTEQTSPSGIAVCPSSLLLLLSHPASSDGCCFRSGFSTKRLFFEVLWKYPF